MKQTPHARKQNRSQPRQERTVRFRWAWPPVLRQIRTCPPRPCARTTDTPNREHEINQKIPGHQQQDRISHNVDFFRPPQQVGQKPDHEHQQAERCSPRRGQARDLPDRLIRGRKMVVEKLRPRFDPGQPWLSAFSRRQRIENDLIGKEFLVAFFDGTHQNDFRRVVLA